MKKFSVTAFFEQLNQATYGLPEGTVQDHWRFQGHPDADVSINDKNNISAVLNTSQSHLVGRKVFPSKHGFVPGWARTRTSDRREHKIEHVLPKNVDSLASIFTKHMPLQAQGSFATLCTYAAQDPALLSALVATAEKLDAQKASIVSLNMINTSHERHVATLENFNETLRLADQRA